MTHISDPYTHQAYRLIQSAFVYHGECSICSTENKDVFSLHQIPKEEYDESQHGPITTKDHFQGVYKDVEVPVISDEKTHMV